MKRPLFEGSTFEVGTAALARVGLAPEAECSDVRNTKVNLYCSTRSGLGFVGGCFMSLSAIQLFVLLREMANIY